MTWQVVLNNWKRGKYLTYPKAINNTFIWRTSVITTDKTNKYRDEFIIDDRLPKQQDYSSFVQHIENENNKYTCVFKNISGDTTLIVPMPKKGKNFATLKHFIDNASLTHKKLFWKKVSQTITLLLKTNPKLYVSTHGHGVPYLHVRICSTPKYYSQSSLKTNI